MMKGGCVLVAVSMLSALAGASGCGGSDERVEETGDYSEQITGYWRVLFRKPGDPDDDVIYWRLDAAGEEITGNGCQLENTLVGDEFVVTGIDCSQYDIAGTATGPRFEIDLLASEPASATGRVSEDGQSFTGRLVVPEDGLDVETRGERYDDEIP